MVKQRMVAVGKRKNLIDSVSEQLILIPEGLYKARFIDHDCGVMFARQAKLMAVFEIIDGAYEGVRLAPYYNVKNSRGSLSKQRWKVGKSSNLIREFCDCTMIRYKRLDQLPLTDWRERCDYVQIKVKTVVQTSKQEKLTEFAQYSVIEAVARWPAPKNYSLVDNDKFISAALRSYANREEQFDPILIPKPTPA